MSETYRRDFIRTAALAAITPAIQTARAQRSPNESVNVAVIGFHNRGQVHIREYAKMSNVRITVLCDADERLFPESVAFVEKTTGHRPATETDIRRVLERKDVDAISIATPDYWHALMTIWACQAGKDVYVEKPVSFTIVEGRRMVEAARKYQRIVQSGLNMRSDPSTRAAMHLLNEGKLGKVYGTHFVSVKPRGSIGHAQESSIPQGVHWDLYLGPTSMRPFTTNIMHYGWHFLWDMSTSDVGNTAVHGVDEVRWGLGQHTHPVKVNSAGGFYVWDADQQTPNFQTATVEYADGSIIDMLITNLYAPSGGGTAFYTSRGYLSQQQGWKSFIGKFEAKGGASAATTAGIDDHISRISFPTVSYTPGPPTEPDKEPQESHFQNFIDCVRSRKVEDLHCDILEGHLSTSICHLANISYRTGRRLVFNPATERFVNDAEADRYLTRPYRTPYVVPDKV